MPKSIHLYQQQISVKKAQKCINGIFKASLFEWNFVLFKILQIKNIPALHCKHAYSRRAGPRPRGQTQWIFVRHPYADLVCYSYGSFLIMLNFAKLNFYGDSILNVKAILVIALQKYWLFCILIVFDIMASPILFCSNISFEV